MKQLYNYKTASNGMAILDKSLYVVTESTINKYNLKTGESEVFLDLSKYFAGDSDCFSVDFDNRNIIIMGKHQTIVVEVINKAVKQIDFTDIFNKHSEYSTDEGESIPYYFSEIGGYYCFYINYGYELLQTDYYYVDKSTLNIELADFPLEFDEISLVHNGAIYILKYDPDNNCYLEKILLDGKSTN
jgi:hypothetical protein